MDRNDLDYALVPLGLALVAGYHLWLLHRIIHHPTKTVIGINAINRRIWVERIMEDPFKNGILGVQTLRNNIMASTLLATAAVMLCTLIVVLMSSNSSNNDNNNGNNSNKDFLRGQTLVLALLGNRSYHLLPLKFFAIILCFTLAFFFNLQSVRLYSHGSMLISVPKLSECGLEGASTQKYVARVLNRAAYFWSLGTHTFYFSIPMFLWLFGPVPMVVCSFVLVAVLYFLDLHSGYSVIGEGSPRGMVNPV